MSNRIALVWAACLLAGAIGVPAAAQSNASIQRGAPQDIAAVHRVMDAYHRALLDHDGAALTALFVPEGGAWLNVMSDAAYAEALAKSPQAQKVRVGSYRDFAAFVSTTKSKLQPTQSNLTIQTDGTIAAATSSSCSSQTVSRRTAVRRPGNWSRAPTAGASRP